VLALPSLGRRVAGAIAWLAQEVPHGPDRSQEAVMRATQTSSSNEIADARVGKVDMKLEVVPVPVSDVDRAREFYGNLGGRLDTDFSKGWGRVVQFTPPGSQCSVHFGKNITSRASASAENLYLIDSDIEAAREGPARAVEVNQVFHYEGFNRVDSSSWLSGPAPDRCSYGLFLSFSDPDGNGWLVQETTTRQPGRIDPATPRFRSPDDLAGTPQRAEAAHGEHEKCTGRRDVNCPDWYASYMVANQAGEVTALVSERAGNVLAARSVYPRRSAIMRSDISLGGGFTDYDSLDHTATPRGSASSRAVEA
jgi:catechol 2,3-dioxygenase-like lactoylglutathione lyase family enzyme